MAWSVRRFIMVNKNELHDGKGGGGSEGGGDLNDFSEKDLFFRLI